MFAIFIITTYILWTLLFYPGPIIDFKESGIPIGITILFWLASGYYLFGL